MTTAGGERRPARPARADEGTDDHETSKGSGAPASPRADAVEPRRPPRRRLGWIVAGVVVIGIGALVVARSRSGASGRGMSSEAARPAGRGAAGADRVVPVVLAPVERRDVPIYLEGLGSVVAYKTVNVHSMVDGRLIRVAFVEGSAVKKGDLLAEVDPRPFTIQLHQAEAALARDEAQLRGAERNLTRYAAVSAERLIPEQQTDDQRATVEGLRGTVAADKAQIENAKLNLSYARVVSPIDGVTGVRQVDQGNIVHPTDANGIVVVTQMDPIAVLFTLPQDDLPRLARAKAKGPVLVEARSRDGEEPLAKGELALVDNQINQTTATLRGKAVFPNPDHALWPNQFVKTRILIDERRGVVVVPAVAIQRGPKGTFVYVVGRGDATGAADSAGTNGTAAERAVEVDAIEGAQAIVSQGLQVGEQVVIEGQSQLRAGAKVSARAGARPGAKAPTVPATSDAPARRDRKGGAPP